MIMVFITINALYFLIVNTIFTGYVKKREVHTMAGG